MESVGAANSAANHLSYAGRTGQPPLLLEPMPERLERLPKRNPRLYEAPSISLGHDCFLQGQYSLPIQSRFSGISYRSTSRDPNSMGLATPIDEITGLPLPILIIDTEETSANTSFSDYHHHYHPERDLVSADDAMVALRRSRGQYLPRWLHEHYHKYFAGPEFPETRQEIFAVVVLACAGITPRKAIDFSGFEGPKIVEVRDDRHYSRVVESVKHEGEKHGQTNSIYRSQIGMFFANYAIEQSIKDVVRDTLIDEFLNTTDMDRRKVLGNLMLSKAIGLSVEPVIPIHAEIKKHSIARRRTDLNKIVKDFFVSSRRPDYYKALDHKLSVA
jgi:hypothetical protein